MTHFCRSCGNPIVWMVNATTGKRAPIDLIPNPAGNVESLDGKTYQVLGKGKQPKGDVYTSHFQTCPDAAKYRAKGA